MQSFQDSQGQSWKLDLTIGKVRKLRESLGLDLLDPNHYLRVVNSLTDRLSFVFLLIQPQAELLGIDADAFEERLYGENVSFEASRAFLEETENFFLRLGQKGLAALAKKSIAGMDTGREKLSEMVSSGELDSLLDKMIPTEEKTGPEPAEPTTGSE